MEDNLIKIEKFDLLDKVNYASTVDLHYIWQKDPKGLVHTVWCARKFIGNEMFAVLLGNYIVKADTLGLRPLIQRYDETQSLIFVFGV